MPEHKDAGVSDAVFMSSRDGVNWDRPFLEAWVRPGPDLKNWTDRNNMTANGIIVTGDNEWSLYISEHYRHADHRIRRLTVRKQGFASMHADAKGGEFTTQPITLHRQQARSSTTPPPPPARVQIEVLDETGKPIPASPRRHAGTLRRRIRSRRPWKSGSDLSSLKGKTIRLRVKLKDADLYALRFAE